MVGSIRGRSVLGYDCDVVFVLDFSIKRRRCAHNARLVVNAELVVVAPNLLDSIRHLKMTNRITTLQQIDLLLTDFALGREAEYCDGYVCCLLHF